MNSVGPAPISAKSSVSPLKPQGRSEQNESFQLLKRETKEAPAKSVDTPAKSVDTNVEKDRSETMSGEEVVEHNNETAFSSKATDSLMALIQAHQKTNTETIVEPSADPKDELNDNEPDFTVELDVTAKEQTPEADTSTDDSKNIDPKLVAQIVAATSGNVQANRDDKNSGAAQDTQKAEVSRSLDDGKISAGNGRTEKDITQAVANPLVGDNLKNAKAGTSAIGSEKTDNTDAQNAKIQTLASSADKSAGSMADDRGSQKNDERSNAMSANNVDKAGIKMDGVDVLSLRSFSAVTGQNINVNNISEAIGKSQQLSGAAAAQNSDPIYATAQPKTLSTLKIQLNPGELGVVTAVMKLVGDDLQVQLRVSNIEAYRLLSEDSSAIVKALRGQGFGIEQINVHLTAADKGSGPQHTQSNAQFFQSQADSGQTRNQSSGGQNNGSSSSNGQDDGLSASELDGLSNGQGRNRSDGVYL